MDLELQCQAGQVLFPSDSQHHHAADLFQTQLRFPHGDFYQGGVFGTLTTVLVPHNHLTDPSNKTIIHNAATLTIEFAQLGACHLSVLIYRRGSVYVRVLPHCSLLQTARYNQQLPGIVDFHLFVETSLTKPMCTGNSVCIARLSHPWCSRTPSGQERPSPLCAFLSWGGWGYMHRHSWGGLGSPPPSGKKKKRGAC